MHALPQVLTELPGRSAAVRAALKALQEVQRLNLPKFSTIAEKKRDRDEGSPFQNPGWRW